MTDEELKGVLVESLRSQLRLRKTIFASMAIFFLVVAGTIPFFPVKPGEESEPYVMGLVILLFFGVSVGLWLHVSALAKRTLRLVFERPQDVVSARIIDYRVNGMHFHWGVELKDVQGKLSGFVAPSKEVGEEILRRVVKPGAAAERA